MATTLTTRLSVALTAQLVNDLTIVSPEANLAYSQAYSWANGTAINTADRIYMARGSATTTPTDLDLAGSLTDPLGATVTFAKVTGIMIKNRSTTAGEIINVGGDTAAVSTLFGDATDLVKVGPDGFFCLFNPALAGYAVTGTTADILQIAAVTGTIAYDIVIIGRSA